MQQNDLEIRPLSPELRDDYLRFFDHDAFSNNPKWSSCYCHCYYFPHKKKSWKDQTAQQNREAVCTLMAERRMQGYLAYKEGKVVGWCNAAPRNLLIAIDEPDPQADQIGAIMCFIVAPNYRGQGIATKLLEAACEGFRQQGLRYAEAAPRGDGSTEEAPNYKGPLSMYLAAGFERLKDEGPLVIVRKTLQD